jgi:exopolysaccharide biosynthesis WecB/TagA/CpsF family protein
MQTITILGVKVYRVGKKQLLEQVGLWCSQKGQLRLVTYVNAHCLNLAQTDPGYQAILNSADLVYADGASVGLAARFLGSASLEKVTGRDWIDDFCRMAVRQGLRVYILAGRAGVAGAARKRLSQAYPGLQIVGARDGFFAERSEAQVLGELARLAPDVLLVGMGAPRQEQWMARWRDRLSVRVCWGVGALFDYVAGLERPVPGWMNALALEWLWRLLMDPRRKWRRYLLGLPLYALRVLRQRLER